MAKADGVDELRARERAFKPRKVARERWRAHKQALFRECLDRLRGTPDESQLALRLGLREGQLRKLQRGTRRVRLRWLITAAQLCGCELTLSLSGAPALPVAPAAGST